MVRGSGPSGKGAPESEQQLLRLQLHSCFWQKVQALCRWLRADVVGGGGRGRWMMKGVAERDSTGGVGDLLTTSE